MTEITNEKLVTFKRSMPIQRLVPGDYYPPHGQGYNHSITQESVNLFATDLIDMFLEDHATGHTGDHFSGYSNHVAGEVFLSVDESRTCHVLAGFETISKSILLLSVLSVSIGGLDTMTSRGWGDEYRDDLTCHITATLNRELLVKFASWLGTKVFIKETVTITQEGKEMILDAIKSGTTERL